MNKYDLEKILPHKPPMILIDKLVEINFEEKYVVCEVEINENKIFYDKTLEGIAPEVGIEFMAQTIGCWAYINDKSKFKIGFLLGTRLYKNNLDYFKKGETYIVKAFEIFTDNEIVSFNCFIYDKNNLQCAEATVNVYRPRNKEELE